MPSSTEVSSGPTLMSVRSQGRVRNSCPALLLIWTEPLDFNDSSVCAVVGNFKNKVAAGKGHIRGSAFFHVDFIRYSNLCGLLAFGRLLFLFFPDAAELFQHILKDGIRLFAFFQAGAYNGRIFSNPHIYSAVPARPSAGLQQQNKQNYIYSRQDANGNSAYYYYFPFGFGILFSVIIITIPHINLFLL